MKSVPPLQGETKRGSKRLKYGEGNFLSNRARRDGKHKGQLRCQAPVSARVVGGPSFMNPASASRSARAHPRGQTSHCPGAE